MANPKGMKTWKRSSLSFKASDEDNARHAADYKNWLCRTKDWFTDSSPCPRCYGNKTVMPDQYRTASQMRTWKKNRTKAGLPMYLIESDRVTCPTCDGNGTIPTSHILDIHRAETYIREQHAHLDALAEAAIVAVEQRLRDHGLRPVVRTVVAGVDSPTTVASYDAWEVEQAGVQTAMNGAFDAARVNREEIDAAYAELSPEDQVEYINRDHHSHDYHLFELLGDQLRGQLNSYRTYDHFWSYPGDNRVIWAGITKPRHYYGAPKADAEIVIKAGRSPSDIELDMIVNEALDQLYPAELQIAA